MECDLVIEYSPLFLLKSMDEGKSCFRNDNKTQVSLEEAQGYCSSELQDDIVFPEDVFPAETRFLLPGSIEERGVSTRPQNNSPKMESTRILDMIKHSPKFLRKKNAKNPIKNVQDELNLNRKIENPESPASFSPKIGFRKKILSNTRDSLTETMKTEQTIASNCKSAISDQEIPEFGLSKGNKNWRKVKAVLKRMNDSSEKFKPVLANSEDNIQEVERLRLKLPPEQIQDNDENEEDVYQRLKAFLNSSEKKFKTSWSPRLQLKSKFSFWPAKGAEADDVPYDTTRQAIREENGTLSPAFSCHQFPILKSRIYPLGMRRCSAPEAVLRREAESFSLRKTAKDVRMNSQNMKQKKDNQVVQPKLYDYREHEVRQRMRLAMEKHLENLTEYCPEICSQLNSTISEDITKYLRSASYFVNEGEQKKIVCLVYIGALKDDGIYAAVRCMWSPKEDRIVVSDYQSHSLYAIAVVFTTSC